MRPTGGSSLDASPSKQSTRTHAWMQAMIGDFEDGAPAAATSGRAFSSAVKTLVSSAVGASNRDVANLSLEGPQTRGPPAAAGARVPVPTQPPKTLQSSKRAAQGSMTLRDVLQAARPDWSAGDLAAARAKLVKVGANSVFDLSELLDGGNESLNRKLQAAGQKTFSSETLAALRENLAKPEVLGHVDRVKVRTSSNTAATPLVALKTLRRPVLDELLAVRTSQLLSECLTVLPAVQFEESRPDGRPSVVLDTSVRYQTFLGFGGSFTESSADLLLQLGHTNQERVIDACFRSDVGLGYRVGRVHINSCDFSRGNWDCCGMAGDIDLRHFSINRYRRSIFPLMHRAMAAAGEQLKFIASPWSPPAWMKDNDSMTGGGRLKWECRQAWARHYVRFAREMDAAGLPLWALTVQNEPMASVVWESCLYSAEEERDFVRDYLGPSLEVSGLDVKLLVWDHNRDEMLARAKVIYSDPEAARHVWGMAFHWYGDPRFERWPDRAGQLCFENVARVHELRPEKHLVMTEGCQEGGAHPGDWRLGERYAENIIKDLGHWTEAWVDWNILLDTSGGPNHTRNFCSAPLLADVKADKVYVQPSFYFIGHFSRYILPGAKRILCGASRDSLEAIAFLNSDSTVAVVVLNQSEKSVDFCLEHAGKAAKVSAPEHSISTFVFLCRGA